MSRHLLASTENIAETTAQRLRREYDASRAWPRGPLAWAERIVVEGSRKRAAIVAILAVVLGLLAWVGAVVVSNTRMDVDGGDGGALRVSTRLPAATCSKTLTTSFPWVRFECDSDAPSDAP